MSERVFLYWKLGDIKPSEITEKEVIRMYMPFFINIMRRRGVETVTREECLEDWVRCYRAWEKKDDNP